MLVLKSKLKITDTTAPVLWRDDVIDGYGTNTSFLFDLGFGYCYPAGPLPRLAPTHPINGAEIRNISTYTATMQSGSLGRIKYAGGGFYCGDVLSATAEPAVVVSEMLVAKTDSFAFCLYVKLPTKANWATPGDIIPIASSTATSGTTFQNAAELFVLAMSALDVGGNAGLQFRCQKALGQTTTAAIYPPESAFGSFCQILCVYDGADVSLRVRTISEVKTSSSVAHTGNTLETATLPLRIGGNVSAFGQAAPATVRAYTIYRGWLIRTPQTSIRSHADADWQRVVRRGAFS